MRLYLSSDRLGERAGSLLALLGSGTRAAIIENGFDALSAEERANWHERRPGPAADLASLGIHSASVDLRDYFGDPNALRARLQAFDMVWVAGGNVFTLRRAMRQSGFDDIITTMLAGDDIVYGGECAGAAVASPSLHGFQHAHNPDAVPDGYDPALEWDGLGLIDHAIIPHYRSSHARSVASDRIARHLTSLGLRYRALRDGEAIVWVENRRHTSQLQESA